MINDNLIYLQLQLPRGICLPHQHKLPRHDWPAGEDVGQVLIVLVVGFKSVALPLRLADVRALESVRGRFLYFHLK